MSEEPDLDYTGKPLEGGIDYDFRWEMTRLDFTLCVILLALVTASGAAAGSSVRNCGTSRACSS